MKVRVHMIADDVSSGASGNCSRCPVALALQRALGARLVEFPRLLVSSLRVCHETNEAGLGYIVTLAVLPGFVCDWIRDFDLGDAFDRTFLEPCPLFDLELRLPRGEAATV